MRDERNSFDALAHTSDGSHYEKRLDAKGRVLSDTCIEGEIPFELPKGWEWARVESVFSITNGKAFKPSDWSKTGLPIVRIQNLNNPHAPYNYYDGDVDDVFLLNGGELLFAWSGTPGTSFGAHIWIEERAVLNQHIFKLSFSEANLCNEYLRLVLNYQVLALISVAHGSAGLQHVTRKVFDKVLLPIPPKVEQRRIAERISELMPLVEDYGRLEDERKALDAALPEGLRKSVLQMAVEGKLLAQNPDDEPASALLERIRAERAKLIKDKKIKAPKGGESVIYRGSDGRHYEKRLDTKGRVLSDKCIEDEIPFSIPNSWTWSRLSSIASVLNGDRGKNYPAKSRLQDEGIPFVSAINIENRIVSTQQLKYLSNDQFVALKAGKLQCNDIVFCIRGSLGKFGIFPFEEGAIASSLVIVRAYDSTLLALPYLSLLLEASITTQQIEKHNNGTAQPNLAAQSLMDFLFPIPPLAEQQRIVALLDELLAHLT